MHVLLMITTVTLDSDSVGNEIGTTLFQFIQQKAVRDVHNLNVKDGAY